MASESESQDSMPVFDVSGLLVALEGHLLYSERPQVHWLNRHWTHHPQVTVWWFKVCLIAFAVVWTGS